MQFRTNVKYVKLISSNLLMSELCLNVCRLCMRNIMSLSLCLKNCTSSKLACLLNTVSILALFSVSVFEDEKFILKVTYTKTETCKLYSGVFGIFLPNVIKIVSYNFELYHFNVGAFFETQCKRTFKHRCKNLEIKIKKR